MITLYLSGVTPYTTAMKLTKTMLRMIDAFVKCAGKVQSLTIISMLKKQFTLAAGAAAQIFKQWVEQAYILLEFNRCKFSQTFQRI